MKPIRSKTYLKWVRSQPCCHCAAPADDAHHVIGFGHGAMGSKAGDHLAVSLCRKCHAEFHAGYKAERNMWHIPQMRWLAMTQDAAIRAGTMVIS